MKKLGFGLMRLPHVEGDFSNIHLETVKTMADAFLAAGFTYFDTAAPYHNGMSEVAFREAVVKRYPRDAYTVTDKLSLFMLKDPGQMQGFFDAQLERLGLTYVDYYLLHALGGPSYEKAQQFGAFSFVQELKNQGRVKHIGMSYHDKAELLDQILSEHPEMEYVQLQLNYLDWEDPGVESRKCYEVCCKHKKPVIVMEPVKGGSLVNIPPEAEDLFRTAAPELSVASWAIRFAASPENVFMVLSGMSDLGQMQDNLSYMGEFKPLSERELDLVAEATRIIQDSITVPCTACRYCVEGCPMDIPISDYFAIYNNLKRFGKDQNVVASTYYRNLAKDHGKASACIACGKCEKACPQHLPIRDLLKDVASALEK